MSVHTYLHRELIREFAEDKLLKVNVGNTPSGGLNFVDFFILGFRGDTAAYVHVWSPPRGKKASYASLKKALGKLPIGIPPPDIIFETVLDTGIVTVAALVAGYDHQGNGCSFLLHHPNVQQVYARGLMHRFFRDLAAQYGDVS